MTGIPNRVSQLFFGAKNNLKYNNYTIGVINLLLPKRKYLYCPKTYVPILLFSLHFVWQKLKRLPTLPL